MRFYWKMAVACAVVLLLVGVLMDWLPFGFSAAGATLLAAWVGIRLVPEVDRLRHERVWHVVGLMIAAVIALGVGGWLHLSLVSGLGFFGLLVLPFASAAQGELQFEKDRRERCA